MIRNFLGMVSGGIGRPACRRSWRLNLQGRMRPSLPSLLLGLVTAGLLPPPACAAPRQTVVLGQPAFVGDLLRASKEEGFQLRVAGSDQPATVPWTNLVRWGHPLDQRDPLDPEAGCVVETALPGAALWLLADGSSLWADLIGIDDNSFQGHPSSLLSIQVARRDLTGVALAAGASRAREQELRSWIARRGPHDRLLLENDDELVGRVVGMTDRGIAFVTDAGELEVPLERVAAIGLAVGPDSKKKDEWLAWVGLTDGSVLRATALNITPEQAELEVPGLGTWRTLRTQVAFVQPRPQEFVYLSDLEPESLRHVSFLTLSWPALARHQNVLGGPLRVDGCRYLNGLGMHSAAQATYVLDEHFRRFEALLAIDDAAGDRGSVVYRVYVDPGSGRWEQRYVSPIVRGGDAPLPIAVELAGMRRVRLLVEFADGGDVRDYANWLDARFVK